MTYKQGLAIAREHNMADTFRKAYAHYKPWWKFWVSESDAVTAALADWDL